MYCFHVYLLSSHSCLLCPIFSCGSAQMPSAGLIKAAPSCCHRNGLACPLASPSAGSPDHTHQRKEHSCGSGRFIWTGTSFRPGGHLNHLLVYLICHHLITYRQKYHFSWCQYFQLSPSQSFISVSSSGWTVRLLYHRLTWEQSIYITIMSSPCMTLWCEHQQRSGELHTSVSLLLLWCCWENWLFRGAAHCEWMRGVS